MPRPRVGAASPWRSRRPTRPRPRSAARAAAAKISRVRRMTGACWRSWSIQGHAPDGRQLADTWRTLGRHLAARDAWPGSGSILADHRTLKRRFHRLVTLAHALVPPPLVLALTTTGGLPYKPRDFGRGDPRSSGWTKGRG